MAKLLINVHLQHDGTEGLTFTASGVASSLADVGLQARKAIDRAVAKILEGAPKHLPVVDPKVEPKLEPAKTELTATPEELPRHRRKG